LLHRNSFIEPCLPTLAEEPPAGPGWVHEVKFDGYRLQLHKEGKDVVLLSKSSNDFTSRFPDIATAASLIPTKSSVILDCELTACADDGTPDFGRLLHKPRRPPVRMGLRHSFTKRDGPAEPQALRAPPEAQ